MRGLAFVAASLSILAVPSVLAQGTTGPAEPVLPGWLDRAGIELPPAAQGDAELFLVSVAIWAVLGAVVVLVFAPLLKWVASKTPTELDLKIVRIVSMPAFILVFTFGLVDSLRVFSLGSRTINAVNHAWQIVVVLLVTYVVYRLFREVVLDVGGRLARRTKTTVDDKLLPLFNRLGGAVIIFVGIWLVVDSFGVNMTLFAAGGALGGLVIAFAAQDTLANFFAGVHILVDQPFREGDRIELKEEGTWGDVVEIGLRSTRIVTRDNRMVIVPNGVIGSNPIINHSYPTTHYRLSTPIGVAYGTDVERARQVLIEAASSAHGVDAGRPVQALFRGFGDSSLDFEVRYWVTNYADTRVVEDAVNTALDKALGEAGIEIPFPQRVLWNGAQPKAPVLPPEA